MEKIVKEYMKKRGEIFFDLNDYKDILEDFSLYLRKEVNNLIECPKCSYKFDSKLQPIHIQDWKPKNNNKME
jgi:hypothetical protein